MATLTVNRIVMSAKRKYVLDNVDGCVLGFSLYKLTNKYNGYCLQVQRQSDNATLNVGFINGYVDVALIESFCAGTTGRVKIWYNQFIGNNATQSTFALMPIICTNGVFEVNGIKFVAANSSTLICTNYSSIDIANPILSLYVNFEIIDKANVHILNKNLNQYTIYYLNIDLVRFYIAGTARASISVTEAKQKVLATWNSVETNDVKIRNTSTNAQGTYNSSIASTGNNLVLSGSGSQYISTMLIFNTNQYNNYNLISGGC